MLRDLSLQNNLFKVITNMVRRHRLRTGQTRTEELEFVAQQCSLKRLFYRLILMILRSPWEENRKSE